MRFLTKLKNIHVQSLLGTGGMSVFNFVLTALLFRSFTPEDIGVWFFFQTSLGFFDTFRQGFLTTTFVKFYSGTSDERGKEVIGSTWYIATLITAFFVLSSIPAFLFLHLVSNYSLSYFLKNYGIYMVLSLPMIIGMCVCQGQLRFDRLLYIRMTQVLILILSVLTFIYFNINTLDRLMFANFFSVSISSLLVLFKGWSGVEFFFRKSKGCIKELFDFGKFTVGSSISTTLFGITNTYMIVFFLGPAALAIYNLGYRLIEIVEIPLRSFIATALPTLSLEYNEGKRENVIVVMKKYIGSITISIIPLLILAFIFADYGMSIIGGGKYKDTYEGITAANIFRILSLYSLLYPLDRFLAVTLDVIHKPEVNFIKILVMLIVNMLANLLGIYLMGDVYGIVIGTIFPTIVAVFISYTAIQKYYLRFSLLDVFSAGYLLIKELIIRNIHQFTYK